MLKQRVITGLPLAIFFISTVLLAPLIVVEVLFAIVVLLAAYEWAKLSGVKNKLFAGGYAAVLVILILLGKLYGNEVGLHAWIYWLALAWWVFILFVLFATQYLKTPLVFNSSIKLLMGLVTLLPMWYAFNYLYVYYETGAQLALFVMMVVWAADIGAYFAGRAFGKVKLASIISPGKTLEGVLGGLLSVAAFSVLAGYYFEITGSKLFYFIVIAVLCSLVSVAGDLFESLLKRQAGVKDSSNLIPGHGGLLDRIDSLTAAVPLFVLGYTSLIA